MLFNSGMQNYITTLKDNSPKCSKPNVIHRANCPVCGKKLVNIYWHNKNWQCSKCMKIDDRGGVLL